MYWILLPNGTYLNLSAVHELMSVGLDVVAVNGSQSWIMSSHVTETEAAAALVALMSSMGQGG